MVGTADRVRGYVAASRRPTFNASLHPHCLTESDRSRGSRAAHSAAAPVGRRLASSMSAPPAARHRPPVAARSSQIQHWARWA